MNDLISSIKSAENKIQLIYQIKIEIFKKFLNEKSNEIVIKTKLKDLKVIAQRIVQKLNNTINGNSTSEIKKKKLIC